MNPQPPVLYSTMDSAASRSTADDSRCRHAARSRSASNAGDGGIGLAAAAAAAAALAEAGGSTDGMGGASSSTCV